MAGFGSRVATNTAKLPRKVHVPASFAVIRTAPAAVGSTE
jgi:hypothetical protein